MNSETDFVARNRLFHQLVTAISRAALELPVLSASTSLLLQAPITVDGTKLSIQEHIGNASSVVGEKIALRRIRVIEAPASGLVAYYMHNTPEGVEPVVSGGVVSTVGQLGVLLSAAADAGADAATVATTARRLCMHIAAANPTFLRYGPSSFFEPLNTTDCDTLFLSLLSLSLSLSLSVCDRVFVCMCAGART